MNNPQDFGRILAELRLITDRLALLLASMPSQHAADVTIRDPKCCLGDEGPVCGDE